MRKLRFFDFFESSAFRGFFVVAFRLSVFLAAVVVRCAGQAGDGQVVLAKARAATVVVLAGEGAGRLRSIGTGVIVSKDGVILTALHAVKGALEVQVRLANGEVFDRVELLGMDERRDVAALKIPGSGLAMLTAGEGVGMAQGDAVYAVTNTNGLTWSATEGIVAAVRPAEEVAGAGSGYRLMQFTAPVGAGASGGALVNRSGEVVGIITRAQGNAGLAVPVESVAGLAMAGPRVLLGSGAALELPQKAEEAAPKSSAAIASAEPKQILKGAKTIYFNSKTMFLTVDTLERALAGEKEWGKLGLTIVGDMRVADVVVEVDRPLFTYVHTFVMTDKRTSIVLGTGKQTAWDGTIASGGLAKEIVKIFAEAKGVGKK